MLRFLGVVQSSAISPKMVLPPDSPPAPDPWEPPSEPSCPDGTGGFTHPPRANHRDGAMAQANQSPPRGLKAGSPSS